MDRLSSTVDVEVSDQTARFLEKLENYNARFRYLEVSWSIHEHEIVFLDRAVWEIRRFCNSAIYDYSLGDENIALKLDAIENLKLTNIKTKENTAIPNGCLERILDNKIHPARKQLIWSNFYYSSRSRKEVKLPSYLLAENSPFYLNPEIVEEVAKYVMVPKEIINGYKAKT